MARTLLSAVFRHAIRQALIAPSYAKDVIPTIGVICRNAQQDVCP